jgi:hypothetical protein
MEDQLFQLSQQLSKPMIDPVEFGEVKGAVTAMQQQVADIKARQVRVEEKLDKILTTLSEAKGGWQMLLLVGGAGATAGSFVAWALQKLRIII